MRIVGMENGLVVWYRLVRFHCVEQYQQLAGIARDRTSIGGQATRAEIGGQPL